MAEDPDETNLKQIEGTDSSEEGTGSSSRNDISTSNSSTSASSFGAAISLSPHDTGLYGERVISIADQNRSVRGRIRLSREQRESGGLSESQDDDQDNQNETERLRGMVERLQHQLQEANREIQTLRTERINAEDMHNYAQKLKLKLEAAQTGRQDDRQQLDHFQAELKNQIQENEKLKERTQGENERITEVYRRQKEEIDRLNGYISALQQDNAILRETHPTPGAAQTQLESRPVLQLQCQNQQPGHQLGRFHISLSPTSNTLQQYPQSASLPHSTSNTQAMNTDEQQSHGFGFATNNAMSLPGELQCSSQGQQLNQPRFVNENPSVMQPEMGMSEQNQSHLTGEVRAERQVSDEQTSPSAAPSSKRMRFSCGPSNALQCKECKQVFSDESASLRSHCSFHTAEPQPHSVWRKTLPEGRGQPGMLYWPCCDRLSKTVPQGCKRLKSHNIKYPDMEDDD